MNKKTSLTELSAVIEEILDRERSVSFIPAGESMLPLFRDGKDKITLRKPAGKLKKYQIALYRRNGAQFVLHRVVAADAGGYVMCGDHQSKTEHGIRDADIVAVVVSFRRGTGREISCDNILYRAYSVFWVWIRPVRGWLKRMKNALKRRLG